VTLLSSNDDTMRHILRLIRSSPLVGLCYDTPSVEVGLLLIS